MKSHPFYAGTFEGRAQFYCDQETRIMRVRSCEDKQYTEGLNLILKQPVGHPLQKSVRARAEAALRRLEKRGLA